MGWARVAVWARPSKVRTDALHSKGLSLTSHLPATGSYLTWGLSVFKEEVVWLYESCCCQYRWRNATLPEFMALVTLSCTAYVNPQLHVMPSNSGPKDEKIKPEDEHFLTFPFFQKGIIFQNTFPVAPNTNSLVCLSSLDKKSANEGVLTEVEMKQTYSQSAC